MTKERLGVVDFIFPLIYTRWAAWGNIKTVKHIS
jgi:hypothetical protein